MNIYIQLFLRDIRKQNTFGHFLNVGPKNVAFQNFKRIRMIVNINIIFAYIIL